MTMLIELLLGGLLGYLLGSVPTGVLVGRMLRGSDVRQHGSGHTGGMNVSRVAGVWGGVLTAVGDILLGVVAVAGAVLVTKNPWATTAAGAMAVVGHNWSVFIRFAGGIGLSTLTGALLCLSPLRALEAAVGLGVLWFVLTGLLHVHRARATVLVMAAVGPTLWVLGFPLHGILLGGLGGAAVIVKTLPDWNRQYE